MYKFEAREAAPICERVLGHLLTLTPTRGMSGADLRTAVGDFLVRAAALIQDDLAGPPLDDIFDKAVLAGVTLAQLADVRAKANLEAPVTVGAALIRDALINFTLASEARLLSGTTFASRDDVDAMRSEMNASFPPMEEVAADAMDQMTYQALVRCHAAVMLYLVETARPLPRMLRFSFAASLSTLGVAYKLYSDAGRGDEVRGENKVIHPAFMQRIGRALSN